MTSCKHIKILMSFSINLTVYSQSSEPVSLFDYLNVTWDSTSTAASLFLGRYSTFFPLARGGGVCTLFSIPFSIMSNRPPDATITANVSTEGTTAERRRTVVALTGGLKWTRDPLARLIPYSFFRGGIVNHMRKLQESVRLLRLSDLKYRQIKTRPSLLWSN